MPYASSTAFELEEELSQQDVARLRARLLELRSEIVARSQARVADALENDGGPVDEADAASQQISQDFLLRLADKDRRLLREIDRALQKTQTGEYGYCEGTGEPIPLARLEVRPWARYSVEYQEQL